jgi:integrase
VTFRTLRHTAATLLSLDIEDPLQLRDTMGHADLQTTLKYGTCGRSRRSPASNASRVSLKIKDSVTAPGDVPPAVEIERRLG